MFFITPYLDSIQDINSHFCFIVECCLLSQGNSVTFCLKLSVLQVKLGFSVFALYYPPMRHRNLGGLCNSGLFCSGSLQMMLRYFYIQNIFILIIKFIFFFLLSIHTSVFPQVECDLLKTLQGFIALRIEINLLDRMSTM